MKKHFCFLYLLLLAGIAQAQTKINSYTFGAMEARWLGPGTMSGRITAIVGVNDDSKTLYVGSAGGEYGRAQMPVHPSSRFLISTV